jgi:hypothetical protein
MDITILCLSVCNACSIHFFAGSRGESSAACIKFVLPDYVPSLATKWADVMARCWETLAAVQMVMDI